MSSRLDDLDAIDPALAELILSDGPINLAQRYAEQAIRDAGLALNDEQVAQAATAARRAILDRLNDAVERARHHAGITVPRIRALAEAGEIIRRELGDDA